jgi:hypothetical protein
MDKVEFLKGGNCDEMISAVADRAQKDFQRIYLDPTSGARRVKTTKDKVWIEQHSTDQVDMATVDYRELPADWQSERRIGAQIAVDAVLRGAKNGEALDENFIETLAELLHIKWLERNSARATETERRPYAELPENEKERDRFFARAAVEVYKDLNR